MNNRGNALFLILVAIALFASLSYAFSKNQRSTGSNASKEKIKLQQGRMDVYTANINTALMRLQYSGCTTSQINYSPPASFPSSGNFSCYVFHPKGGGAFYDTQLSTGGCLTTDLLALSAGQSCGTMIYVGVSGGNRIYTAFADMGRYKWGSDRTIVTGATSATDGLANTNKVLALTGAATYPAFSICRSLGTDWYLPSNTELTLLYTNRNLGALAGTFDNTANSRYWSSTETGASDALMRQFSTGSTQSYTWKDSSPGWFIRCVRRVS